MTKCWNLVIYCNNERIKCKNFKIKPTILDITRCIVKTLTFGDKILRGGWGEKYHLQDQTEHLEMCQETLCRYFSKFYVKWSFIFKSHSSVITFNIRMLKTRTTRENKQKQTMFHFWCEGIFIINHSLQNILTLNKLNKIEIKGWPHLFQVPCARTQRLISTSSVHS